MALKRIGKALSDVERLEQKTKKPLKDQGLFLMSGGQGGIRTRVGILSQTRFPGVRLKPLIHLSVEAAHSSGFALGWEALVAFFLPILRFSIGLHSFQAVMSGMSVKLGGFPLGIVLLA